VPTVRITSPNGGESWSGAGPYTVAWTASDADGDALTAQVLYSTDAGQSWAPLAVNLSGRQLAVQASDLPWAAQALVKVVVTDGVNTSSDTSDAAFAVALKPPRLRLLGLEEGSLLLPTASPALAASAFDPEGTELAGELWTGDADAVALRAPWTPDAALHFGHGLHSVAGVSPALGRLFVRDRRLFYACAHPDVLANAAEIVSAQLTAHLWTDGGLSFLSPDQTDALLRWGAGKYGTAAK
jgi:hypothetical protein